MVRFGVDRLIPEEFRSARQEDPLDHPAIRREVERLQRIVEGQNYEIRKTLRSYSVTIEKQRQALHEWRLAVLTGAAENGICAVRMPERYDQLCGQFGREIVQQAERIITLHHIDQCWIDHLALIAQLREEIHLVRLGRMDPLYEFHKRTAEAFHQLHQTIEERIVETFATSSITKDGIEIDRAGLRGPSSTWTYLINDRAALNEVQQMLFGHGNTAFALGAVLTTWPLLLAWRAMTWFKKRNGRN